MSKNAGWPDPRNPHPLSHLPDRLAWRAARTASGCRLADLEALVWQEVQSQALKGAARGLTRRRRRSVVVGAAHTPARMRRARPRADV